MEVLYAVKCENVFKEFKDVKVLDNVSIYVPQGYIYGLLGPNGAGKTTLIRILNRIFFPDRGKIEICGYDYFDFPSHIIGYLPEERGLYRKMKVGEHIAFLAKIKGKKIPNLKKLIMEKLEEWGMHTWYNKRIEELSKGMQQKVQLLAAIIHKPELLILDEPFTGLDPINMKMIQDYLVQLAEKEGTTIILSTHDMSSVEEICRYVCLINKGKKVLDGEVSKLKYYYRTNIYEMLLLFDNAVSLLPIEDIIGNRATIINNEERNPFRYLRFKVNDGHSGYEILEFFKNMSGVEIIKFERVLPSIRDIFVQKVAPTE